MKKLLSAVIALALMLNTCMAAENSYFPSGTAEQMISAIAFDDTYEIPHLNFAKDAAALGLMFGDGQNFNAENPISNAEALKIIYRSVGREEEGLAASYNLELRESAGLGEYTETSINDGFYMLALADGLISNDEFIRAYTNSEDALAKKTYVTVNNFIKWFSILHGIKRYGDTVYPGIDPAYMSYYSAMKNDYILTNEDISMLGTHYLLTNDLCAYILKKAESRIMTKIGVTRITGRITSIHESMSEYVIHREITLLSNNNSYILNSTVSKTGAFYDVKNDYPVLAGGRTDLSGSLREGDRISVYLKDSKILFVRDETIKNKNEYLGAPVIMHGTLYVHDYKKDEIVLDNVNSFGDSISGYVKCYLNENTKFYHNGELIDKYTLNTHFLDRPCTVFMLPSCYGGMERAYTVVFE